MPPHNLVTTSGQPLKVVNCAQLSVRINTSVMPHHFSVVNKLIIPIILGINFLQGHNLVLDFSTNPVTLSSSSKVIPLDTNPDIIAEIAPLLWAKQLRWAKICAVMAVEDPAINLVNEAIIPLFGGPVSCEPVNTLHRSQTLSGYTPRIWEATSFTYSKCSIDWVRRVNTLGLQMHNSSVTGKLPWPSVH